MIKQISIKDFKSLGNVTVALDPVTVLIGRSGTGKTNFVEALRFFRGVLLSRNFNFGAIGGWQQVLPAGNPKAAPSFKVVFEVPGLDEAFTYELTYQSQGDYQPNLHEEKLVLGSTILFHARQNAWVQPPKVVSPPSAPGLKLGSISGIQEINIAYLVLSNGIGCYEFASNVLQQGQQGQPVNAQTGLRDNGDNFLQVAQAIVNNLQSFGRWKEVAAAMKTLNSRVNSVTLRMPDQNEIQIGLEFENKVLALSISQESEGFRRFLAHLLALYQTPPKQTLVFEEPERGIHPGALAVLAEEFRSASENGRGQVILTSHSPELLDNFSPESIRVVDMVGHSTQIGVLAEEQLEAVREQLLSTGELLTVDQARLPGQLAEVE
jgi:predicted ATPase